MLMEIADSTLVFQNREQALFAKKASSANGAVIGCDFTTSADLVADEWELWGDGRKIISSGRRSMTVYSLLPRHSLNPSAGTAQLVADFISKSLCMVERAYPSLGEIEHADLPRYQKSVLFLAKEYADVIKQSGFVEPVQTLGFLEGRLAGESIYVLSDLLADEPYATFLKAISHSRTFNVGDVFPTGICSACDTGAEGESFSGLHDGKAEIGFLVPQGADITSAMILEEIENAALAGDAPKIAVCCESAYDRFNDLSGALCEHGFSCALKDTLRISDTFAGRAVISALSLICRRSGGADCISLATDFAINPLADIGPFYAGDLPSMSKYGLEGPPRSARDLNTIWRSDRTLGLDDMISDLLTVSPTFAYAHDAFCAKPCSGEGEGPIDPLLSHLRARIAKLSFRMEDAEMQAVSAMGSLCKDAFDIGISPDSLLEYMRNATVRLSCSQRTEYGRKRPFAYFSPIDIADELPLRYFDLVILDNATDKAISSKERAESLDGLLRELGVEKAFNEADRAQLLFDSALGASRGKFVCVLPQLDEGYKRTHPSFPVVELVSSASCGKACKDLSEDMLKGGKREGADGAFAICCRTKGEGDLESGVGRNFQALRGIELLRGCDRARLRTLCLPSHLAHIGAPGGRPVMSPSSVESYLMCHYRWFVERIVSPYALDEGFGIMERGSFAHLVIERFYSSLNREYGASRLGCVPEDDAYRLFEGVFDGCLSEQYKLKPASGRYVPCNSEELIDANLLKRSIYKSIELESSFPDRFADMICEACIGYGEGAHGRDWDMPIGAAEEIRERISSIPPVDYAGVALRGKIDRIDVDSDTRSFCIIDYKGSLAAHEAGCKVAPESPRSLSENLPEHVQALIYASLVRKSLMCKLSCKAALYTSYRARSCDGLVVGSYEWDEPEIEKLSNAKSAVCMDMDEYLDLLEEAVGIKLDGIFRSDISYRGRNDRACRYCEVPNCEGRHLWG